MRYGRARAGGSAPEDPRGQRADTEVDDCHERHHRADEHEHRRRIPDQFLAGGPDDLLELGDDLPDEAGDAREETEALGLLAAARTRRGTPGAVGAGGACPCGFAHSWSLRVSVCPAQRDVAPVRTDGWLQGRRDSNPQPPVLETGALPIAPLPYRDNNRCAEHDPSGARRLPGMTHHGGCQPPGVECTWSRRLGRTHPSTRSSRPDSVAREHQPLTLS